MILEKYDVAIIGGGSAGLAALKQLSKLGKQAILLEAGTKVGSKNISGGILYSKKPKKGKVTNVDELYENFLDDDGQANHEQQLNEDMNQELQEDSQNTNRMSHVILYKKTLKNCLLPFLLNQYFFNNRHF